MPRHSLISRLPSAIREKIGQLRDNGHTIDEIMAALNGIEVSRSALGRHIRQRDKLAHDLRKSREISESLVTKLGDKEPGRQSQVLIELMHTALLEMFINNDDGAEKFAQNPKTFGMLAEAINSLARASKTDVEYRKSVEDAVRKQIEGEVKGNLEQEARKRGLSAETVQALMQGLGVKK